jgi:hypothetical protein
MGQLTNFVIDPSKETRTGMAVSFQKANVKAHTRKTKSGKLAQVKQHMDKRKAAQVKANTHEAINKRVDGLKKQLLHHKKMAVYHDARVERHKKKAAFHENSIAYELNPTKEAKHMMAKRDHERKVRFHEKEGEKHINHVFDVQEKLRLHGESLKKIYKKQDADEDAVAEPETKKEPKKLSHDDKRKAKMERLERKLERHKDLSARLDKKAKKHLKLFHHHTNAAKNAKAWKDRSLHKHMAKMHKDKFEHYQGKRDAHIDRHVETQEDLRDMKIEHKWLKQGGTPRQAIVKLKKIAVRYGRDAEREKNSEDFDKETYSMHKSDQRDILKMIKYIKAGKWNSAARVINNMDTEPRDQVPNKVMRFLNARARSMDWSA